MRNVRFDLYTLIEWTAGIAFLCALLVGSGGTTRHAFRFTTVPTNDSQLHRWLEEQGNAATEFHRIDNSIIFSSETSLFDGVDFDSSTMPRPPWNELGYAGLQSLEASHQWAMFSAPTAVWIVGLTILVTLGLLRRRMTGSTV